LTESAGGLPPERNRENDLADSVKHLDTQLTQLLTRTNELLSELVAALRTDAAFRRASAPVSAGNTGGISIPDGSEWGANWAKLVSRAFEAEDVNAIQRALLVDLDQRGQKLVRLDFDDAGEYQQDRSYARFSENQMGCLFIVGIPDVPERYLALPYPVSATWFLQSGGTIYALYALRGAEGSTAPRLTLQKPAILCRTDEINARGNPIYKPVEKGEAIAQ